MARRSDHQLMIEQKVDGKNTWAVILLLDKDEIVPNAFVTGLWKQTNDSYNDEEIKFTSAHPQHLYFEWKASDPGGILYIGTLMAESHAKKHFQILITLSGVKRLADGKVQVASSGKDGSGKLTYNVAPHFKAGAITWSVIRYQH